MTRFRRRWDPPPPVRDPAAQWEWCEVHAKRRYVSRAGAKAVIRLLPDKAPMREYRCTESDGKWHVGHLPPVVVEGTKTADEVYRNQKINEGEVR